MFTAGTDYVAVLQKVTFLSGQSKVNVYVSILDDTVPREPDIYFFVNIIYNRNTLAQSVVTIIDNDHGKFLCGLKFLCSLSI